MVVFQLLSCVWLFVTPWTAARQASLSLTISQSLLRLMSIESMMGANQLILCCPLLLLPSIFPSIRVFFLMSQLFASGGQSVRALASASVLPVNIQGWFPLGSTGLIFLPSKGFSRVFSNTTVWKHRPLGHPKTIDHPATSLHSPMSPRRVYGTCFQASRWLNQDQNKCLPSLISALSNICCCLNQSRIFPSIQNIGRYSSAYILMRLVLCRVYIWWFLYLIWF